jgi:hypothetical protein
MMALQALRFLPLYAMVFAVAAATRVGALWPRLTRERAEQPGPDGRALLFGRANAGVFAVATLALAAVMLTNPRAQVHAAPLAADYPTGAVAYLRAHPAATPQPLRLFHDYGWGGYLIAQGFPVFVDGRADPYNTLLDDYVAASAGTRWQPIFARYGVNAALIRPGSGLDRALQAAPGWRVAYQDALSVLYLRK